MQYGAPTQRNDLLDKAIERMQVKEATKTYNGVVERCFEICASNFQRSKLDTAEDICIDRCFEKFVKFTQRLSTTFQEQNLLAAEEISQQTKQ